MLAVSFGVSVSSDFVVSLDSVGDIYNSADGNHSGIYPGIDIVSVKVWSNESHVFFQLNVNGSIEDNASVVYKFDITSLADNTKKMTIIYSNRDSYAYSPDGDMMPCENEISFCNLTVFVYKSNLSFIETPWGILASAVKDTTYKDTAAVASFTPSVVKESPGSSTPGFVFVGFIFALLVFVYLRKR